MQGNKEGDKDDGEIPIWRVRVEGRNEEAEIVILIGRKDKK